MLKTKLIHVYETVVYMHMHCVHVCIPNQITGIYMTAWSSYTLQTQIKHNIDIQRCLKNMSLP